ncbi:MAG: hypothetical protein KKA64_00620 [Nanoarchaeota archaeon]|nr:hypothetical protein [Nanoarchaeota archaeon]
MQEGENVLNILEGTKQAIKEDDVVKIKELSNMTIHTASTTQDPDNIAVAVIVYSLSKIIERKHYRGFNGWGNFYRRYLSSIDNTIKSIKKEDKEGVRESLGEVRKAINSLSGDLRKYVQDVFKKASINKASKIYEHGISLEQTAKILGISVWDLSSYIGQKGEISDIPFGKTLDVKDRIKIAMEMFR